jgi:TolB-like protein
MKRLLLLLGITLLAVSSVSAQQLSQVDQRMEDLSQRIAGKMSAQQKKTIAVIEFADLQGRVTEFGRYVAEELITRLYDTGKFKVIERQLLNKIIAEQKLSLTGVVDPGSAQKLGRLLGVDSIASGTITDLGTSLKINARLIDAATAEIFAVAAIEIVKDDTVTKLMGAGAVVPASVGKPTDAASAPPAASSLAKPMKVTVAGFSITLNSCKMASDAMTCSLLIVNETDKDSTLYLYTDSRAIDDLANDYKAGEVQLSNKRNSDRVYVLFVPGVPLKGWVKFTGIDPQASKLNVLRLQLGGVYADFRNVPIERQ